MSGEIRFKKDTASRIVIDMLDELLEDMNDTLVDAHVRLSEEVDEARESKNKKLVDELNYTLVGLSNIRRKREDILKYMKEIKVNYIISDEQSRKDVKMVGILNRENKELKKEIQDLVEKINILESQPKEYINIPSRNNIEMLDNNGYIRNEQLDEVSELLELFRTNMKSIVVSEKMKEEPGRKVDNRITDIILDNYESGMTPVELQNKLASRNYKVSLPTIIERMKDNGWYNGRKNITK